MEYPLISEYREAILSAEDNFNELASLRPVLDGHGDPVMSSGNFAVVFKMEDMTDGKLYAVKCFIKEQEGRDESYRKIADELEMVSSSYILPLRYLEDELFVDSAQCDCEEFPVVVMEWVDGETLDSFIDRHLNDRYEMEMLSYRFCRMAAWLLAQPFAHGDLKPDNILVREDGSLVLVDYDGMFVPAMKGEKSRESGSPNYRHPLRSQADFNEHIDDFSIALIAMSLKAIALNPDLRRNADTRDALLYQESDFRDLSKSAINATVMATTPDATLQSLYGAFMIALSRATLDTVSFRLFMTAKPQPEEQEQLSTEVTDADLAEAIPDEYGVLYSPDGKRLLKCEGDVYNDYKIKPGTKVICKKAFDFSGWFLDNISIPNSVMSIGDSAFSGCGKLQSLSIPNSVNYIGNSVFHGCKSLQNVTIPNSVKTIGINPFMGCKYLNLAIDSNSKFRIIDDCLIDENGILISYIGNSESFSIPNSVKSIGDSAFSGCESLQSVSIPNSVKSIGDSAFSYCVSLQRISIPNSVKTIGINPFMGCENLNLVIDSNSKFKIVEDCLIDENGILISYIGNTESFSIPNSVRSIGDSAFYGRISLQRVSIPNSVKSIGDSAFYWCKSLQRVSIPNSVKSIGDSAFYWCESLQSVSIPDSVKSIGNRAFYGCKSLQRVSIPNSVMSIRDEVFSWCDSLQSVSIPNSVKTIGINPFMGCKNLNLVIDSNSKFKIVEDCLIDETGVLISYIGNSEYFSIPNSVRSIGDQAFYQCTSLQSVSIPNSVKTIGAQAFFCCFHLHNIFIPKSVISIGKDAFIICGSQPVFEK